MKKFATLFLTVVLAIAASFSFAACGQKETKNFGKDLIKYDSQLDTLTNLKNGTVDMCIIDSVMAGYYATNGEFKDLIKVLDEDRFILATEKYGIAGRKEDKSLMSKINEALIAISESDYQTVAETYGLTSSLCLEKTTVNPLSSATDESWNKIKTAKKIIIGYTVFAPIAYDVVSGTPSKGFDIDLAKAVIKYLNNTYSSEIVLEFQEIDWDSKEALLKNGTIDLIWNGLTITDERVAEMCISVPYLNNNQVAVITKTKYESLDLTCLKDTVTLFANATIGVESGSAGESVVLSSDK